MFLPQVSKAQLPDMTEAAALIDHYFRFAMPTFRFLHQPTISRWMHTLIDRKPLEAIQAASVLIVLSHALMYSERAPTTSYRISDRSISYLQQAKALFSNEAGPAQVASVEARLATCLVLLSICHVNECRFLFGTTHTLVITLGLHRKTPKQFKMSPLESQRRKRVFWSFYAIDGYISVMLGQPRLLRDEDVDQEYPENIDDTVLDTATDVALCPHHGSMEASVFHAKLARLFARSNDLLYPIGHLSTVDIIQRSHGMVEMLNELERELPPYLQPRAAASLGTQTWDRQNSVLGLAIAHARILATRRSILLDITSTSLSPEDHEKYQTCLRTCLEAICAMIDRVHPMMLKQRLLWGFWLTLYSTTCAISTLLVYKMQQSRTITPDDLEFDMNEYYQKAEEVQVHLAGIAPEASQAKRHHQLLGRLKQRANRAQSRTASRPRPGTNVDVEFPCATRADDETSNDVDHTMVAPSAISNDQLTPNEFDFAFMDDTPWQFLDQLNSLDNSDLWSIG